VAIPPDTLPVAKPIDTHWLWAVRILTLLSPVGVWATLLVKMADEPFAFLVTLFLTLPAALLYLWVLWRLRAKTRNKGLAYAVGVGSASFITGLLVLLMIVNDPCRSGLWGVVFGGLFPILQLALITSAIKAYFAGMRHRDEKPTFGREIFRRALYVGIPLFLIQVISIPNILRSHSAGDHIGGVGMLREINTAEITYASTYSSGFSPSLAVLGPPTQGAKPSALAAGLINNVLASGAMSGYKIDYKPGPVEHGRIDTYTVTARPIKFGCPQAYSGEGSYFSDQSGVIRQTNEDRPATANDTPIGG
jgi:hypothetical protein